MPTPTENTGEPEAWNEGAIVKASVPVRCETAQREAAFDWREARRFGQALLRAARRAERSEWLKD